MDHAVDEDADISKHEQPCKDKKQVRREECLEELKRVIEHFNNLPKHERFSFATNAEVYQVATLILNVLLETQNE